MIYISQNSILKILRGRESMFRITKPVRLIELFAGIGSQAMALRDLGVDFEHWKTSDWWINSVASYKAIHCSKDNIDYSAELSKEQVIDKLSQLSISTDGKSPLPVEKIIKKKEQWLRDTYNLFKATNNLGSIINIHAQDLEINDKSYEYIMTYSFPCWSISVAGKREGMDKGSGTGSSLIWEIERLLNECKEQNCLPDVLLMENVNAIHNKTNIHNFNMWLNTLSGLGYKNYWQDMNAKDYGVAQNRVRCFVVSLLSDEEYIFPKPIELTKRFKDYLEDNVPELYYINNEKAEALINKLIERGVLPRIED